MVLDWAAAMRAGLDAVMIAQSEAEVTELNRLAAEHMAKARKAAGWRPGLERVRLSDGNLAQVGDWIQARLNDQLITAGGQWLANRDILQITRIYGHGRRPADRGAAAAAGRDLDSQVHPPGQVRGEIRHPRLRLHHLRRAGPHRRCRAWTGHPGPEPGSAVRAGDPGTPGEPAARGHRPRTQRAAGRA